MGWSNSEELLCVQNDGVVLIYDLFGRFRHKFYISDEAKDTKVIDARLFPTSSGTGVAVMTTNFRVFLINNIKDPKTRQLPEMPSMYILSYTFMNTIFTMYICDSNRIPNRSNVLGDDCRRPEHLLPSGQGTGALQVATGRQCLHFVARSDRTWLPEYCGHGGVVQPSVSGVVHESGHHLDGHHRYEDDAVRIWHGSWFRDSATNWMVRVLCSLNSNNVADKTK